MASGWRMDRLLSLYLAQPALGLFRRCRVQVPILMYHSISAEGPSRTHPYFQVTTSPKAFAGHMAFLREAGYRALTLQEALGVLTPPAGDGVQPGYGGARPVVLTFDDGFRDFYAEAAPVLQQYGFTATVFLPTAYITEEGTRFKGTECLRWSEITELRQAGFHFGSHTVTHPRLSSLEESRLQVELAHSRLTIEDHLGEPVDSFSYPYAYPDYDRPFSRLLHRLLVATGYRVGVTTRLGMASPADSPLCLKRIPVNSHDDWRLLAAKLNGAYDWLYGPQCLVKMLKTLHARFGKARA